MDILFLILVVGVPVVTLLLMCFDVVLEKLGKVIDIVTGATQSEDTIYGGGASHVTGFETRGGRLSLTPVALNFQSHGLNIGNKSLSIPLKECASVATYIPYTARHCTFSKV